MLALTTTHQIIIGVVVLTIVLIAAYYFARMLKGKIEIQLPKAGYNRGEEVAGTIALTCRKSLQVNRLYVALIGYEVSERIDSDGHRKPQKNEIYRSEMNLLEAGNVPAGVSHVYDFSIPTPGSPTAIELTDAQQKVASAVGTAVQALGALGKNRRLQWKLEARADLPGVDIAKSQKLRINLM